MDNIWWYLLLLVVVFIIGSIMRAPRDPLETECCPNCGWCYWELLHYDATFAVPECWYKQCEKCDWQ